MRVRLFQKRKDGAFYRETHLPGQGRDQAPLHTRKRDEAERLGRELLARFLTNQATSKRESLTLGELWKRYSTECPAFLDNKAHTRGDEKSRAKVLLAYFGSDFDVRKFSAHDVAQYEAKRLAGGIKYGPGSVTRPVRQRSAHADLSLLRRLLRWAASARASDGQRWLENNPLAGIRFEREKNPLRPIASIERFQTTRRVVQRLAESASNAADRVRWTRLDLALFLAEGTGRRRGAIIGLRWEDVEFARCVIHWRAEFDKKGKDWLIPMPQAFADELKRFQRTLGAVAGFLFPRQSQSDRPMPPELLTQWLAEAERAANLPKLKGGLWHPYRRKWASERMHLPLRAVADAGGWSDPSTLVTCYQ